MSAPRITAGNAVVEVYRGDTVTLFYDGETTGLSIDKGDIGDVIAALTEAKASTP